MEAQLQSSEVPTPTNCSNNDSRVSLLEQNFNLMLNQMNIINSKVSDVTLHLNNNNKKHTCGLHCVECDKIDGHKSDITQHLTENHETPQQEFPYPCHLCSYKAIHSWDLKRHQNVMHGTPIKCNKCGNSFDTRNSLMDHLQNEHRASLTFYRSKQSTLDNPAMKMPNSKTSSGLSKATYVTPTTVSRHDDNTNSLKQFKCQGTCSAIKKTFTHEDELELHLNFYHEQRNQ